MILKTRRIDFEGWGKIKAGSLYYKLNNNKPIMILKKMIYKANEYYE